MSAVFSPAGPARRVWVALFGVIALAILAGGYRYYRGEAGRIRQQKYGEIATIAGMKAGQIVQWRKERLADVVRAANGPRVITMVAEFVRNPDPATKAELKKLLDINRKGDLYANVILFAPDGKKILAAIEDADPVDPVTQQTVAAAFAGRNPAMSDFFCHADGIVHIDAADVVPDAGGRPLAVMILRSNAADFLYPMIQSWPTHSRSAETVLVQRRGEEVLFMNELRHRAGAALSLREPLAGKDLPTVQAVLGKQGMFQGKDYRGVEVLADLRPVPGFPWFMVSKGDTSEILAEVRYRAKGIAILVVLLILLAAAATDFAYRQRQAGFFRGMYQSERQKREAQETFRTTFYSIGDAIITTDVGGRVQEANPVAEALTGWSRDEARGRPLEEVFRIINETTRATAENPVQRVLREGAVVGLANHTLLIARDGSERPIADSAAPIRDEDAAVIGVVLVFRDQTVERAAQNVLRERETQLRATLQSTADGILAVDNKGKVLQANRRFVELWRIPQALLDRGDDRAMLEFVMGQLIDPKAFLEKVQALYGSDAVDMDTLAFKDGRVFERYSNPMVMDGAVTGRVWSFRDISALKRVEGDLRNLNAVLEQRVRMRTAELDDARRVALSMMQDADHQRQSAESALIRLEASTRDLRMLSRAIENSPAMVVITDDRACIQYVNPKFTEVTGYTAGESIGQNPRLLKSGLHPPEFYREMWTTLVAGRQWQGEFCNKKKNGELYWEFASIVPMKGPGGELMNYVAVKEDITERRRFIQELKEAKQAAESANQAKSAFLANMSHEIRTPMNAILGFSQLMQDDPLLTPVQRQHLEIINRSGGHLLALINDILEMSKIEAGRLALNPVPFDLRMLIGDMELMFRLRAEAKHLQFTVERQGDIPDLVVADEGKVRQVLINLLGNALKFTEKGGIVLRVRVRHDEPAGLRLLAEVEDTGPGISEDELGKLFRPFTQASAGLLSLGGTGLGLAISREFVRLMNGDITVTSQPGEGSVFRVDIAMQTPDSAASIRKVEMRRVKKLQDGQPPCRVLIADDNEENRQLLFQMLGRVGFELQQVANGEDAVNAFDAWHPRLILMDMRMPVVDGYTAIRRIRASAGGKDVKIIAVTASAFADTRQEVFAIGADDFMGKPFREKELFWTISHLLGVTYVYEDELAVEPAAEPAGSSAPDVQACLPDILIRELREAVVNGDFDRVMDLAAQVKTHDARLAGKVRELAGFFDSPRLLELLGTGGA